MSKAPLISARELLRALGRLGFIQTRQKGSHVRLEHPDGRKTTVPVHKGRNIPRGLLHDIIVKDVGITMDEFASLL